MKLLDYPVPNSIAKDGGYVGAENWAKYCKEYLTKLAAFLKSEKYSINIGGLGTSVTDVTLVTEGKEVVFTFSHDNNQFSCVARNRVKSGPHGLGGRNHYFKWETVRYFQGFAEKIKALNDCNIVLPQSLTALFRGG